MRLHRFAPLWVAGVLFTLGVTIGAAAEPSGMRAGWHVVRPGETLHAVAQRYLGDSADWPSLAALNPSVSDPNLIYSGQRIRVRVLNAAAPDTAQLTKVSRRVEEQLRPLAWSPASEENFLNTRDGVRTFRASSAELVFSDASKLVVSEDSLVFLGSGGDVERTVKREEIEIVVGQADLEASEGGEAPELRVGESLLRPQAGAAGVSQARARRPEGGGAELMVYEGAGVVQSGGATQQMPRGTGTKVEEGQPPAPPERLLQATAVISPEEGSSWPIPDPTFSWEPLAGAAQYVVEVCRDRECSRLAARRAGITDVETRFDPLEAGSYFWRVTAVAPSGLDGYPSPGHAFSVEESRDRQAPRIAAELIGSRREHEGKLYLGAGSRLEVSVEDDDSGLERVLAIVDGEERSLDDARGPWSPGPHEIEIVAEDRAGNESRSDRFTFVYDPDPPVLAWGPARGVVYRTFSGETPRFDDGPSSHKRGWKLRELLWHSGDANWKLAGDLEWTVRSPGTPAVTLGTSKRKQRLYAEAGFYLRLRKRGGAVIEASDALSGTTELKCRVEHDEADPRRRRWLHVEAEDRLGNRSTAVFELWRGRWTSARRP